MNMQEIRDIAKSMGIKTSKVKKVDLVKSIQKTEGNNECFSTAMDGNCGQLDCLWRTDCFSLAKKPLN
jgi:hypothetical protein